ncbi:MAG: DUF58 domain-containing protein [Actinobacteria bacterium]|nr:DUF58 domain-containing protein [Actinomycetota bacterium]
MTGRAIGLLATVPVLAALSWWLGYPVLAIVAFTFAFVLVIAAITVARPPTSVIDRHVDPLKVTRGQPATVVLTHRNRSPLPSAPIDATDAIGHLTIDVTIPVTRPRGTSEASYRFVTSRRGYLPIGPAVITRRDPWGIFRRSRQVGGQTEISVYPRIVAIPAPDMVSRLSRDAGAADVAAGSDRFHTLREYVVGDELRKVHWPSSAKTGTLVVKQMVDSPQPRILLFCDCGAGSYADPADFESALDATASLANSIVGIGVPTTVVVGQSHRSTEVTRTDDISRLLENLLTVAPEENPAAAQWLRSVAIRARATALIVVTGSQNNLIASMSGLRSTFSQTAVYRLGTQVEMVDRRRGLTVTDALDIDALEALLRPKAPGVSVPR